MGLDPTQRARMIDFLTRYQEVFAWSYADMPGLDPSIVKHFLPLDTEKFPPKRQQLRRQRAGFLLRIKEEVVKQINAGFLKVCNYSEWVATIVPASAQSDEVHIRRRVGEVVGVCVKGQAIADPLAEFPIEDSTPINPNFPDEGIFQVDDEEEKPGWKMYFDSAVNSAGSGIDAVLISPDGRYYPVVAKIDFPCTNNVAEYEACILGLQAAIDFKVKELEVFDDSMLTIFQTLGQWKTKVAKLVPYHEYLERLMENFEDISFTYTPCMNNQFTDALVTLASMHVKHCHRCQVYADQIKAPPNELHPMTAPWPFSMWGMDVIGLINPKASNGHMFILVVIDYFTKWIEAITLASVTTKAMAHFHRRDVIARYGFPATIITDMPRT
ncbi:hypothetical protein CRG98_014070 [Punica granatum]|uniref:Integrase catalytic domain-containing protein n=1 Tax=Punica granatum TaxID=22663 RepID=A0A2I0KBI7_PUNGR|nr:hypothetical protein CRG98_014070 [Punica granatum]